MPIIHDNINNSGMKLGCLQVYHSLYSSDANMFRGNQTEYKVSISHMKNIIFAFLMEWKVVALDLSSIFHKSTEISLS